MWFIITVVFMITGIVKSNMYMLIVSGLFAIATELSVSKNNIKTGDKHDESSTSN